MQAGRLRHRVELQRPDGTSRNRFNEARLNYTTAAHVWAAVEPLRGNEYMESQKLRAELTYRIRIRYYPGVTTEWRVKFGDRLFNIQSVINVEEHNREMQLMAIEALK